MCLLALAAGAAKRTTAQTARNALHTDGLPAEGREHPSDPLLQLDLGLPAENLLRPGDVRLANLGIVDRERLVDDLPRRAGDAEDGLGELVERELARVPDVHRQVLAALGEQHEPADQVVDVAEAPRLRTVAEDRDRRALERLAHERRHGAPVVRAHARAVGVEDPDDRGVDALLAVVGHRERLRVALRLVVDAARPDGVDVPPVALRLRMDERVAVHLARRGEQEARALVLREAERVVGPVRADLERVQRHAQVVDRARERGQVEDDVDRLADLDVLDDVVVEEDEVAVPDVLEVRERARLEVVDADDAGAAPQQGLAKVRAEEPRAPGHDRSRHVPDPTQPLRRGKPLHGSFTCAGRARSAVAKQAPLDPVQALDQERDVFLALLDPLVGLGRAPFEIVEVGPELLPFLGGQLHRADDRGGIASHCRVRSRLTRALASSRSFVTTWRLRVVRSSSRFVSLSAPRRSAASSAMRPAAPKPFSHLPPATSAGTLAMTKAASMTSASRTNPSVTLSESRSCESDGLAGSFGRE